MSREESGKSKLPNVYQDFLRSIDDFFSKSFQHLHDNGMFAPSIPIRQYEKGEQFIIEAELPGVSKNQIQLDVFPQYVRIRIHEEEVLEMREDEKGIYSKSISSQARERVIPFPYPVQEGDIKARLRNGLLTIAIPNHRKRINIE
ncbi:Hsp20/alpha crystallin family protein [Halalkalibacterium halodurans]|jgi:HSP20 family molecular chaperone IbpA|uniref:Heat shock protein class I (Low molecular weight) n=2 Tax=Halalkalibacterium halodurans TaxID=86665 RepID=Q9KAL5_HALH5|nr:Hsp20/alpha crystallin family protein [Halalkalibacterium halodurans]MDY7222823.1 Hsp20/alpha crystallin family protein [Halalkalibacterium halodurans]MDY7242044.1 Hsp20/alpha crystallin family protein [Halalkalibacterium halodurans]MED3647789.1 Hsp20/alpha crystallin family protein [Halalkalibacterium halodurans]MED4126117.1 Hsp20/alpha crystallin family protein [Halalkalibacterium halodurans]MED4163121.1 Hsp20/alpha crystallin family protein [Halalkalibacterium halodurans]